LPSTGGYRQTRIKKKKATFGKGRRRKKALLWLKRKFWNKGALAMLTGGVTPFYGLKKNSTEGYPKNFPLVAENGLKHSMDISFRVRRPFLKGGKSTYKRRKAMVYSDHLLARKKSYQRVMWTPKKEELQKQSTSVKKQGGLGKILKRGRGFYLRN